MGDLQASLAWSIVYERRLELGTRNREHGGVEHDVLVSIEPKFGKQVTADWLAAIVRLTLEMEKAAACQVGVVITGDEQMLALNREYAGEDHATDVLTFSLREGEAFVAPDEMNRLGEVVVSYETARRQAEAAGHDVDEEVAHLLVHGVLHLLGYDHAETEDETRMRTRERRVLGELGITPTYPS
jgi:probable rRNA maturation factor